MISIVIPSYNRAKIICPTLDSILSQTYDNWECIIVDDHSLDNTKEVIEDYVNKDSRIRYLLNERKKGAQGARNTGLFNCHSEWVYFFDSDNLMHPDCLEEFAKAIEDGVDVIQCFSKLVHVDIGDTGRMFTWKSNGQIHDKLFSGETYVDFNHSIIRRSKVLEIGGLDEDCPSMQEWDTHIRLSNIARYKTIERPLIDYFIGGKDAISTDTKREVSGRMYILTKYLAEWSQSPKAIHSFVGTIASLIRKNSDPQFRRDAYRKLCDIVPKTPRYEFYFRFRTLLSRIKHLISYTN